MDTGPNAHEHCPSQLDPTLLLFRQAYSGDSLGVVRRFDMPLSNQAREEMRRDNASLRMSSEEDCVGTSEVVDPSWVREVRLVQTVDQQGLCIMTCNLPVNTRLDRPLALERDEGQTEIVDSLFVEKFSDGLTHHICEFTRCSSRFTYHPDNQYMCFLQRVDLRIKHLGWEPKESAPAGRNDIEDSPSMNPDHNDPLDVHPPIIRMPTFHSYPPWEVTSDLTTLFSPSGFFRIPLHLDFRLDLLCRARIYITPDSAKRSPG